MQNHLVTKPGVIQTSKEEIASIQYLGDHGNLAEERYIKINTRTTKSQYIRLEIIITQRDESRKLQIIAPNAKTRK
jgi:hypothetical protein